MPAVKSSRESLPGDTPRKETRKRGSKCLFRAQVQEKSNEASLGNVVHRCHRTDGRYLLSANSRMLYSKTRGPAMPVLLQEWGTVSLKALSS